MNRFLAILLSGVILFSSADLFQLLKIPQLAGHYTKHRAEEKSLSFIDFLAAHYIHADSNQDSDDMELPFKQSDFSAAAFSFAISQASAIKIVPRFGTFINNMTVISDRRFDSEFSASIWQPPKNA